MANEEIDGEVRCLLEKLLEIKGPVWDGSVVLRLKVTGFIIALVWPFANVWFYRTRWTIITSSL